MSYGADSSEYSSRFSVTPHLFAVETSLALTEVDASVASTPHSDGLGAGLSAQEEVALGMRIVRHGCVISRNRMVDANMHLVTSIAQQYLTTGRTLDELVWFGTAGLLEAVSHFDPTEGVRFSRGASWWIKQAMKQACRGDANQHGPRLNLRR